LFLAEMPRENREIRLIPVDDAASDRAPVIRLESRETLELARRRRQENVDQEATRLDVPARDEVEIRTHEPDSGLMSKNGTWARSFMELPWDDEIHQHAAFFRSLCAVLALSLAGFALWSLSQSHDPDVETGRIRALTEPVLAREVAENLEAAQLIDRIEAATRRYFATSDPATLASLSRHPERVAPLIARHYQDRKILPNRVAETLLLQPLTLDRRADFWMHTVRLENKDTRKIIIQVPDSGEPRIDWEAFVGHQPMKWDDFARERPTVTAMDFRVYLEPDHFFSHEFADASQWSSFRLTALQSEETLFGYVENGSPVAEELHKLLGSSDKPKIAPILKLRVPAGFDSRRGVIIEKLVSPCWIHLDSPDA
jgi:hypothetical protein